MSSVLTIRAATPADSPRLRAFVAAERGEAAARELDRHLARPRYRPQFTCIAEQAGAIVGYALIMHERRRLGRATLETGWLEQIYAGPSQHSQTVLETLMGDCLSVLLDHGMPLARLRGPAEMIASFGFAPYRFGSAVLLAPGDGASVTAAPALRLATERDQEDLAALYEASYHDLPLSEIRAAPDWRAWLGRGRTVLALEDNRGRLVAYAALVPDPAQGKLRVAEAATADSGAARALCAGLLERAASAGLDGLHLALPLAHPLARAALHMGGSARLAATAETGDRSGQDAMAGVVDLPGMLEALVPEFERRLAGSRYVGWSGNLRVEIETERITLALASGRATMIDGSRPADVRLRNVTLPALAQLCLGYRDAADLRATGGMACDDSTLGLIDTLFPIMMACGEDEE